MAKNKSMGETIQELRELLVAYARQETVEPLGKLKQYLGYGIPGAFLVTLGVYLVFMGIVRLVQHWDATASGYASLVPYAAGLIFLGVVAVICGLKARQSMAAGDDGTRGDVR